MMETSFRADIRKKFIMERAVKHWHSCSRQWRSPHPWKDLNALWMWHWETWASGKFSSAGGMGGVEDLRGLLHSEGFCASVNQEGNFVLQQWGCSSAGGSVALTSAANVHWESKSLPSTFPPCSFANHSWGVITRSAILEPPMPKPGHLNGLPQLFLCEFCDWSYQQKHLCLQEKSWELPLKEQSCLFFFFSILGRMKQMQKYEKLYLKQ